MNCKLLLRVEWTYEPIRTGWTDDQIRVKWTDELKEIEWNDELKLHRTTALINVSWTAN